MARGRESHTMSTQRAVRFVDIIGAAPEVFNEALGGLCVYTWMAITHHPATREAPETFTLHLLGADDTIVDTVQRDTLEIALDEALGLAGVHADSWSECDLALESESSLTRAAIAATQRADA